MLRKVVDDQGIGLQEISPVLNDSYTTVGVSLDGGRVRKVQQDRHITKHCARI